MEKKNPFVTTIGFKKEDPDHVYVAELLNSMGRRKAQYIVKAVLAYQSMQGGGKIHQPLTGFPDYNAIRRIVLQVLEENKRQKRGQTDFVQQTSLEKEQTEENILESFDTDTLNGILDSLEAFKR